MLDEAARSTDVGSGAFDQQGSQCLCVQAADRIRPPRWRASGVDDGRLRAVLVGERQVVGRPYRHDEVHRQAHRRARRDCGGAAASPSAVRRRSRRRPAAPEWLRSTRTSRRTSRGSRSRRRRSTPSWRNIDTSPSSRRSTISSISLPSVGRGRDAVRPRGLVAVGRGEPDHDVLARRMRHRWRALEPERLHPRVLDPDLGHLRELPLAAGACRRRSSIDRADLGQRRQRGEGIRVSGLSHRCTAARAMGRPGRGSPGPPRSRARRGRGTADRATHLVDFQK